MKNNIKKQLNIYSDKHENLCASDPQRRSLIFPLIILVLIFVCIYSTLSLNKFSDKTLKCVDGDTFALGKTYYRLSFIDTPEKGQSGYKAASLYTCEHLMYTKYILRTNGKDIYGRTLVEVIFDGEESLNTTLVRKCLADPFYGKTTSEILKLYSLNCK